MPEPTITPWKPVRRGRRLFFFVSLALGITLTASLLMADLLWRTGWTDSRRVVVLLFTVLLLLVSFGCLHAVYGFFIRRWGDRGRITLRSSYKQQDITSSSTAVVLPIYNEEVGRVFEGLRVIYESLEKTSHLDRFDFFILSDSTDLDKWIEEERGWLKMCSELSALGRIFYRRRANNEAKKSGNVRDFLNAWGKRYRYMIVLDADSIMRGETMVDLVKLMEANPTVGLIQTSPGLVGSESLFGRAQQFANRFYGPLFVAGLNYWMQEGGNYWGHNAIIRVEPFMTYCDLPHLPGAKPFGGQILSHDFVEAALLRKNDWEVWLAWDLDGTYEEGPQGLIESAQRDRRWCQGNLQHTMLLFARGFRGISRVHLALGILGYLASPIWFLFLALSTWVLLYQRQTGLSVIPVESKLLGVDVSLTAHGFLVFGICMGVLFLPKICGLLDLIFDRARAKSFGGLTRASASVLAETIFFTLVAPVLMLFHSVFVLMILLGKGVNWGTQKRVADGTAWSYATRAHWGHTLLGLGWGTLAWWLDRPFFWWLSPVLSGMALSIPVSVLSSRASLGKLARKLGLFLTPEELSPPWEITRLRARMALDESSLSSEPDRELSLAVLDPYVNATHVSLLRERSLQASQGKGAQENLSSQELRRLGENLLGKGPRALSKTEKMSLFSDVDAVVWLHSEAWLRPAESLHAWWKQAMRAFAAI